MAGQGAKSVAAIFGDLLRGSLLRVRDGGSILLMALLPAGHAAAALPGMDIYNMRLYGTVSSSSDGKTIPSASDTIIAVNMSTGATEMSVPPETDSAGNAVGYQMQISKPQSFLNTRLQLYIQHQNTTYKFLNASGTDAIIAFNGVPGFFPQSVQINLVATSTTTGTDPVPTPAPPGNTPPPALPPGDLNGDGAVNETDVALLKEAISGKAASNKTTMDINGDQVVNTRDLIDLIRMVREKTVATRRSGSIIPATTPVR